MSARIHPTAVVDPSAELADGVEIGPHAVIGAEVEIGEGTEVGAGAQVQGPTRIGRENRISAHAAIGFPPQDLKFQGERVALEIGDRNHFREFCTVHRGTAKGGGLTRIGSDGLFMVYAHVAHDCQVGDRVIFANCGTLAGHVEVGDDAVIGAFSAVHQFNRVGRHAYIGGYTRLTTDALPFAKTVGMRPAFYGLNRIGLRRKGLDAAAITALDAAFRIYLRSHLSSAAALEILERDHAAHPEVRYLIDWIRASRRGVCRTLPGRPGRDEEVAE
ncbi:MAG: acyl-ACP--UDP-N-acetylglucosamine O-acyltransferase [Thermoanaerobaculia bacterium]|nr:acyl-ACP--UDP-N-acetylglucosamine O-acyltransferase [Thermoanaerobaculia bacterium]